MGNVLFDVEEVRKLEIKVTGVPYDGTSLTSVECLMVQDALSSHRRANLLLEFKELRIAALDSERDKLLAEGNYGAVREYNSAIVSLKNEIRLLKMVVHG